MKNKFLYIIAVSTLFFASCKKSYTCDCTSVTTFSAALTGSTPFVINSKSTSVAYSEKMSEKQAKSACDHEAISIKSSEDAYIVDQGAGGLVTVVTTCAIK